MTAYLFGRHPGARSRQGREAALRIGRRSGRVGRDRPAGPSAKQTLGGPMREPGAIGGEKRRSPR